MNPLEALNILEKKIELFVHQLNSLKKENNELRNIIQVERERNTKLEHEIAILKQEKQTFDYSKQEIRTRIEELIRKLNTNQNISDFSENEKVILRNIPQNTTQKSYSGGIDMMDDDGPGYYDEI